MRFRDIPQPSRAMQVSLLVLLSAVVLSLAGTTLLRAQENVGQITGVVQDPSGANVPNATVAARNVSTGVRSEVSSGGEGTYRFPSLPIGEYVVSAHAEGFKTLERPGVRVVAGVSLTLPLQLEVGQITQSVTVSGAATHLDTTATTEGTTRVTEEMNELPLLVNGGNRNAINFISTMPGVQSPVLTGIETTTINGAPEGGESLTIDGVMGSVSPSSGLRVDFSPPPEAIAEMRLSASDTSEYGWNSGVGVVLVTKSGTNQLHGDVFEYFRNKVLNARNWFATDADPSKQNEYGFTLGGPVYIPKVYNGKDKTFFFLVFSGYRYRTASQGVVLNVPTAKMRTGDFSELLPGTHLFDGYLTTLPDPDNPGAFTRTPFPGNIIPPDRLSKMSTFWQKSFPTPNRPGFALNWVGAGLSSPVNSDKGSFKIDQNLAGGRQRITFAYDKIDGNSISGGTYTGSVGDGSININNTWTSRLSYMMTISPNMIVNLRVGLNRNALNSSGYGPQSDSQNAGSLAGFKGTFSTQMPHMVITDFGSFGPPSSGFITSSDYTTPANADLTWAKGNHNLKFGAAFVTSNSVLHSCNGCSGSAIILPFFTSRFFPTDGYGYADFLMGTPLALGVSSPTSNKFQTAGWGFYGQDLWRVTNKLTLSYGLRYDRFDMPHESYNRMSVMDPTLINHQAGGFIGSGPGDYPGAIAFFGKGPGRNGLTSMAPPLNFLSPRLGFAYTIRPKTVIRASYGISTSSMFGILENGVSLNGEPGYTWNPLIFFYHNQYGQLAAPCPAPYGYVNCPYQWDIAPGLPLREPTLPNLDPTQGNGITPPYWNTKGLKAGYSQNINFGVEREVRGILVKGAYVANLAHNLPLSNSLNTMDPKYQSYGPLLEANWGDPAVVAAGIPVPFPGIQGQVWRGLVSYPQYASVVNIADPIGYSYYHSFQGTAQKRFGNGLSFLASYTISKQLTNYGSFGGTGTSSVQSMTYKLNYLSRHLVGNDRPQNFTVSYVYDLPFGPGRRFANGKNPLNKVVGGWRVSGIDTYTSGTPITVTSNFFQDGLGESWPVRINSQPMTLGGCGQAGANGPNGYLNPSAFVNPPLFGLGNTATLPNVRNCSYFDEDFSVQRVFKLGEHFNLLLSGDSSNLFNRHTFIGLESNISQTAAFGRFSGATPPREVQVHAKIEF